MSAERQNYLAEYQENQVEELILLVDEVDIEKLHTFSHECGIGLTYLKELDKADETTDEQVDFNNIVISELPQSSEEELRIAARAYSMNLNKGLYRPQDSEVALRAKKHQSKIFVSVRTSNEIVCFEDFNLLFHLLRHVEKENDTQFKKGLVSKIRDIQIKIDQAKAPSKYIKVPISEFIEIDNQALNIDDENELELDLPEIDDDSDPDLEPVAIDELEGVL